MDSLEEKRMKSIGTSHRYNFPWKWFAYYFLFPIAPIVIVELLVAIGALSDADGDPATGSDRGLILCFSAWYSAVILCSIVRWRFSRSFALRLNESEMVFLDSHRVPFREVIKLRRSNRLLDGYNLSTKSEQLFIPKAITDLNLFLEMMKSKVPDSCSLDFEGTRKQKVVRKLIQVVRAVLPLALFVVLVALS